MTQIYIGGDSFCYYRNKEDWPAIVASLLGHQLAGQGFPGDSWWHTRKHLLQYLKSHPETQTFILCHTDPFRPLTGQQFFKNAEAEQVKEQYFKYFVDYEVSLWTVEQWYLELNELLKNRQVIHFQSFASSRNPFKLLSGIRVATPLINLSLGSENYDFINDPRRNHFSPEQNQLFAELVINCLASQQNDLEISFKSTTST
jgi:hypothetical protein